MELQELFWPHQTKFSYPIGPSKAEMTPQGYKARRLGDGLCVEICASTFDESPCACSSLLS